MQEMQHSLEKIKDILIVLIITIVVIFVCSTLLFKYEQEINPQIDTMFDSVYLTVVTITSIGYGDSYPMTGEGKIVAMFLMFFSIVLIGAIAGIVSHNFIGKPKRKDKNI